MRFPHEKERTERMARATHLTIGTADRIRLDARCSETDEDKQDEVRQEVQISVTYALEPGDTDLTVLAEEKAEEVQRAHEAAWNRIGALGTGARGGAPCARLADRDEDESNDWPDDGSQEAGAPPGPPPAIPPAGAWHLPSASRPSAGNTGPDAAPDAEPVTGPQKILIRSRAGKIGLTAYALESLLYQQFKVLRVDRLSRTQATSLLDALDRDLKEREQKERGAKEREQKEREQKEKNGAHGSPAVTGRGRAA